MFQQSILLNMDRGIQALDPSSQIGLPQTFTQNQFQVHTRYTDKGVCKLFMTIKNITRQEIETLQNKSNREPKAVTTFYE